jgi:FkbH-like protein
MRLSYTEIQDELDSSELSALPPLRIAVLRNVVVEPIEPYLRYFAYRIGFSARCEFGAYDNVYQEAVAGQSGLLDADTDCLLVFLKLENLSWDLARRFAALSAERIRQETQRVKDIAAEIAAGIRRQTAAMIVWNGFELPVHPSLGILDYQRSEGETAVVEHLNAFLRDMLAGHKSAYLLDVNACLARVGARHFYDLRYWHLARAPYSLEALEEIGGEIFKYIRALKGRSRKCLVLDCDNVLWGGIVGEDGLAGIRLGQSHPGSPFREFQQEVLNLHSRGVVLALCSKNNEADVWEVFDRHPDMLLRREHIAAARINWSDKVSGLTQIAEELELGLDSLVFVDDSPLEADMVRQHLPQVTVVELPEGRAVENREILSSGGWFDTLSLSQEDRQRGAMYRAEAARREMREQSRDLGSYYGSLEMVLEIRVADELAIPRVAQLTQKTNQFSLTTRRYGDADIARFGASPRADVVHVRLKDRFGDSGITGVCILEYEGGRARIDTFLLSCRVLGRGVEDALLVHCMRRAKQRGCRVAVGEYRPTAKNAQVKEFYPRRGFRSVASGEGTERFELDLTTFDAGEPPHFHRIDVQFPTVALAGAGEG